MVTAVRVYTCIKKQKTPDCYVLVEKLLCLRCFCCGVAVLVVCSGSLWGGVVLLVWTLVGRIPTEEDLCLGLRLVLRQLVEVCLGVHKTAAGGTFKVVELRDCTPVICRCCWWCDFDGGWLLECLVLVEAVVSGTGSSLGVSCCCVAGGVIPSSSVMSLIRSMAFKKLADWP